MHGELPKQIWAKTSRHNRSDLLVLRQQVTGHDTMQGGSSLETTAWDSSQRRHLT
jgi:hypothetical protein